MELGEFVGRTIIYYSWGDQLGHEFLAEACDNSFTDEEMQIIFSIIANKDLPAHQHGVQAARYHFLMQKYAELKRQESMQSIKSKFAYFKAMIEKA